MEAIEVSHLTFSYDGKNDILKDVSFSIPKGSYTTIIGHNGSGKSTMAKLIIGLLEAKKGKIQILGQELNEESVYELRSHIGIVFQNPDNQFIGSTVADDIAFGLENHCVEQEKMQGIIEDVAGRVGMTDFLSAEPTKLSGGQKQRVAIARALSNNPKVLLSDEATSALDPDATESILKLLRDLNKRLGITIILITHEMSVIKSIANRVAVMENGKVVEEGDVYDIFANPKEEITKKFINSSSALSNITKLIENKTIVPADSKLVKLTFTRDSVGNATISKISREYNVDVNIMLANVDVVNADALGGIIASIEGTKENVQRAIDFLHESNVKVEVIHHA